MAYESKIIIANARREYNADMEDFLKVYYAEIVAVFNLSCMGYNNGWKELFDKEIDFDLYIEDGDHATRTDKYGEVMKEAELGAVIEWLEKWADTNTYRRTPPFLAALKALDPGAWDELHIVHYGY